MPTSVMPKGVEHWLPLDIAIPFTYADLSDAERR